MSSEEVYFAGKNSSWYAWLSEDQQQLVEQTHSMIARERDDVQEHFDYSYLVFSMAKVYEGFIKMYLLRFELIDEKVYNSKRFRIGRAINPDIRKSQRDEYWLYDDVEQLCGQEVARQLWETWLHCRNRVFHYFPQKVSFLSFAQALECVLQIEEAMEAAVSCQLQVENGNHH